MPASETGSIGDRVWVDANGGVQDAGEVGKAGVTVRLYTCVDEMPGTGRHQGDRRQRQLQLAWCRATTSRQVHRR
ncbi:MAG: hypothetical protein KF710_01815 [Rhodocyclaceae bacterium]|nr:hypothetical protein [Rhodocyclaceae bacterium]